MKLKCFFLGHLWHVIDKVPHPDVDRMMWIVKCQRCDKKETWK